VTAAWTSHDVEKTASYYADDVVYEDLAFGMVLHGKEELKTFLNDSFAAFPDLKFEVKSFFVSSLGRLGYGGTGVEWVMSGTHKGDLRASPATGKSIPATGRSFSVRGVSISETRKGKIKRNSDYYDLASIMRQLGVSSL
jgi:steroid delta-isomerase-like uncharacterized protein